MAFGLTVFQGCSNDGEQSVPKETHSKADLLVASPDFQNFQESYLTFAENVRSNYKKLSKSDKAEFKQIAEKLKTAKSDDRDVLYERLNSIIKIDLKSELSEIRENSFEKMSNMGVNEISRRELLTAIQKQGILQKDTMVRLKSRSETSTLSCKEACAGVFTGAMIICLITPPPADIACAIVATGIYVICIDQC